MTREKVAKAATRAILAFAFVSVVLAGFVLTIGLRTPLYPTYTLNNGVTVKVIPVKPNEVMDVLEWKRWKFHATVPPTANGLQTELELWRNGKAVHVLGGGGYGGGRTSSRTFDVTITMRPEYGDWSKDARFITRIQFGQGGAITGRSPNPYRNIQEIGSTGEGTTFGAPNELPNDALLLTTIFYQPLGEPVRGGPPRDTDPSFSLVLRIRPQFFPQDAPVAAPNFWQSLFAGQAR